MSDAQAILSQYSDAIQRINALIEEVLHPIKERLQNQSDSAFTETSSDPIVLQKSKDHYEEARQRIERIDSLLLEAADEGLHLEPVDGLKRQVKLTQLKLLLAWSLDLEELKWACQEGTTVLNQDGGDGTLQVLVVQAGNRSEKLHQEVKQVGSGEERRNQLDNFIAGLQALEQVPVELMSEYSQAFYSILELNKKFHRHEINKILNERAAGEMVIMELPEFTHEAAKIRNTAIRTIREFIKKSNNFINHDPVTAEMWFEPVYLFQKFLVQDKNAENNDLDLINEISKQEDKIQENLLHWQKADEYLREAKGLCEVDDGEKPWEKRAFWLACQSVKQADQEYKDHPGIDEAAKHCINSIIFVMRSGMGERRKECEKQWGAKEKQLVSSPDWEDRWLINSDLPAWLKDDEQTLKVWLGRIESLQSTLKDHLGEKYTDLHLLTIDNGVQTLMERYILDNKNLETIVNRRRSIRKFIVKIQDFIRQGGEQNQGLYQEAEQRYEKFLSQHPYLKEDVELGATSELLRSYLSESQILKIACEAYRGKRWDECISNYKEKYPQNMIRPLGKNVDEEYVNARLKSGFDETLVALDVSEFARVLFQLAYVHWACIEVMSCAQAGFYAKMGEHLNQVEFYGQGDSPIVSKLKIEAKFDERKAEFEERKAFGDHNYLNGETVNDLAIRYATEYHRLVKSDETGAAWIDAAQANLDHYADLDPQKQSLWVGDARENQKELANLFFKRLQPYLAALVGTAPALVSTTLEQAFSFLQTARRYGYYYHLNVSTRRWITYQYYLLQENRFVGYYPKICAKWREAVVDFPDDEEIVQKFREVCWNWWLAELDRALNDFAAGKTDATLVEYLLNKNADYLPDLFNPVKAQSGLMVNSELDQFHTEIVTRRESLKKIQQADSDLRINPASLPVVLRQLREAKERLGRAELVTKEKTVAESFTQGELELADGLVRDNKAIDAVEHYLRVIALGFWPGANDWVDTHRNDIRNYCANFEKKIQGFDPKVGSIFEQQEAVQQLSICVEEICTCSQKYATNRVFPSISHMDTITNGLNQHVRLLKLGIENLNRFNPNAKEWCQAVNPDERRQVVINSWSKLDDYLTFLKAQFGEDHQQISLLAESETKCKYFVTMLFDGIATLSDLFNTTENYASCIAHCRQINDSVDSLCAEEPRYHNLWSDWLGKDQNVEFYNYYPDPSSVYKKLKFAKGKELELPYYHSDELFKNWCSEIKKFVIVNDPNPHNLFQSPYQFDEEHFNLHISQNGEYIHDLRQNVEDENAFLGYYLVLAYWDTLTWKEHDKQFNSHSTKYQQMREWLCNQDHIKITEVRCVAYVDKLNAWIMELENIIQGQPIPRGAQDIKTRIAQAIRSGNGPVTPGMLKVLVTEVNGQREAISSKEGVLIVNFYGHIKEINFGEVSEEVLNTVTSLKRFYEHVSVPPYQTTLFQELKIDISSVDLNFHHHHDTKYNFFIYVEDLLIGKNLA